MSRAAYVWVITDPLDNMPMAAFTVKYECADWIDRHSDGEPVNVCRIRDSRYYPKASPVWLDPSILEPREVQEEGS